MKEDEYEIFIKRNNPQVIENLTYDILPKKFLRLTDQVQR